LKGLLGYVLEEYSVIAAILAIFSKIMVKFGG
jgi:hypothetical protein